MRTLLLFFLLGLLMPTKAAYTDGLEPGDHALTFKSTWDGTEQPYRLFLPGEAKAGEPLPLVVVLHGKGVDQNAWFDLTPIKEAAAQYGYIAAAPYGRGNFWYRGAAEQDVLDIIEEAKRNHPVDPARVCLIGHSMGGWGTWWIALRNPDAFATVVSMSGFAPMDMLPSADGLNPFIIHDETDPIVSAENSRRPAARLAELGISYRYRETHGYGHSSGLIGDSLDDAFAWFAAHRRNESPEHVRLAVRTPRKGNAWWLRVLETDNLPSTATIDARVEDRTVTVSTEGVARFALELANAALRNAESITVNGTSLKTPAEASFALFERTGSGWNVAAAGETPSADPFIINCDATKTLSKLDQTAFVQTMSAALIEETEAELALFDLHDFNWQGEPLTIERLLDIYTYAIEELVIVSVNGRELRAKLEGEDLPGTPVLSPASTLEVKSEREYLLLMPERLLFSVPGELVRELPLRPDEYFLRRVERTGCFP